MKNLKINGMKYATMSVVFYLQLLERCPYLLYGMTERECDLVCRALQHHGHVIDHVLDNHDALWDTEAPEGGVGGQVGSAGGGSASQVGDVVGVVHVKQNFLYDLQEREI